MSAEEKDLDEDQAPSTGEAFADEPSADDPSSSGEATADPSADDPSSSDEATADPSADATTRAPTPTPDGVHPDGMHPDARPPGPPEGENEGPPADDRALLFAGWGCVALIAGGFLFMYIMFSSAMHAIDDPTSGMAPRDDTPVVEVEPLPPPPPVPDEPTRRVAPAEPAMPWRLDYEAARAEASTSGKGVVVLITAEWASASLDLRDGSFEDPDVVAAVADGYVPVLVDVSDDPQGHPLVTRFELMGTPTILYLDADGQRLREDTTVLIEGDDLATLLRAAR